jgi:catechol 2,3-dioxygenase-like lactoylglutathione lyase family enzyme
MIDHVYLPVRDVPRSRAFYGPLLQTLGIEEGFTLGGSVVFGMSEYGAFWIYPITGRVGLDDDACGVAAAASGELPRLHVAFRAESRSQVNEFFGAAQDLGAESMEEPRLFPTYHSSYFAAFVRDLDGHNIEAVCNKRY